MKVYMDCCCSNRPFDDRSQVKILLESEAVKTILSICERKEWNLISSDILRFEISKTPDFMRKKVLELMESTALTKVSLTDKMIERAKFFESKGIASFDALHLASAENNADVLLTVDDQFLKKAVNITQLKINVYNPLKWLEEAIYENN